MVQPCIKCGANFEFEDPAWIGTTVDCPLCHARTLLQGPGRKPRHWRNALMVPASAAVIAFGIIALAWSIFNEAKADNSLTGPVELLACFFVVCLIYSLPSFLAFGRNKRNKLAILVLNSLGFAALVLPVLGALLSRQRITSELPWWFSLFIWGAALIWSILRD